MMARQMTLEELRLMIRDTLDEVALCRDKDTGHFDDCSPGNVYSLSKKGAQSAGVSSDLVGRGTMTKNRKLDTPYGANTSDTEQCGRMKISGEKKKKDRRCRDYKDKGRYGVNELVTDEEFNLGGIRRFEMMTDSNDTGSDVFISLNDLLDSLGMMSTQGQETFRAKEKPMLKDNELLVVESRDALVQKCQQLGFKSQQEYFRNLVTSLNTLKQAQDGDLGKKK
jgi:hypothetical protein